MSMKIEGVVENKSKNFVYPAIVEDREASIRSVELNVFGRLAQDRIIFLSGAIDETLADTICAQLLFFDSNSAKPVDMYINSPGGDVYSGLQICSVMKLINVPVRTTILGSACSMAAVIASNGEKGHRLALPYSRFMIHQPLSNFGYNRFKDIKIAMDELESVREDLYTILADNSGKTFEEITDLCENGDFWMKPDKAIELGFLDGVVGK